MPPTRPLRSLGESNTGHGPAGDARAFTPPASEARWRREDLHEIGEIIRGCCPDAVDLGAALPAALPDEFWLPDGLHPSLLGHRLILSAVVDALASSAPGRAAAPGS